MTNCLAQICSRIKNAQNFFKFSLIDISNMLILTLKSKIIFMKLLPPKLARKLKMLLIYLNLAYVIFQICQFWFKCQKKKPWNIYHLLGPKIDNAPNILKFGTFAVSNIPIYILKSKIIFIKFQFLSNFNKSWPFFILGPIWA